MTINGSKDFTLTDRGHRLAEHRRILRDAAASIQVAGADDNVYTVSGDGNDIGGYIPIKAISPLKRSPAT